MNNKRPLINFAVMAALLAFFYLFSPSYFVRYIALFFVGSALLINLYVLIIPFFVQVRHVNTVVRGIKLQEMGLALSIPLDLVNVYDLELGEFPSGTQSQLPHTPKTVYPNTNAHGSVSRRLVTAAHNGTSIWMA